MLCLLLLTESSQVQEHWKEYIEEFYEKNGKPTDEDILLEEVDESGKGPKRITRVKNRKAEELMAYQQSCGRLFVQMERMNYLVYARKYIQNGPKKAVPRF